MILRSSVLPDGKFVYNRHDPVYRVANFREDDYIQPLGIFPDGLYHENHENFPPGELFVFSETTVFEIPNFFPFRGVTYINKTWADKNAENPSRIFLPRPSAVSMRSKAEELALKTMLPLQANWIINMLPGPLALALAQVSTDPQDLVLLAKSACEFVHDPHTGRPVGLKYRKEASGKSRPCISNWDLFETLANNRFLPDDYKRAMVLRPGVQGGSEIVGEWKSADGKSHVFEYHRANSYIPWGHYAANMADDAIRYSIEDLTVDDMTGMRHLYYQRTFARIAMDMGLASRPSRRTVSVEGIEDLRMDICKNLVDNIRSKTLRFNRTLWGWNLGFDFSPTRYRLHASHQQIHQQYGMIPTAADLSGMPEMPVRPYACGDQIEIFLEQYFERFGIRFFDAMIKALKSNKRMDGATDKPSDLIVYSDENVILFIPKAQTSQWEINLLTLKPVGNIVEADIDVRKSIDYAIFLAVKALAGLGAQMITGMEYSKRIDAPPNTGQRLLYSFLPRLPESPGAFSEAQLRWINGHYPEDFAAACRCQVENKGRLY